MNVALQGTGDVGKARGEARRGFIAQFYRDSVCSSRLRSAIWRVTSRRALTQKVRTHNRKRSGGR
jgi:hypothetical protein